MGIIISAVVSWIVNNILNRLFPGFTARNNKALIEAYERRIQEKDKSIKRLTREQKRREKERFRIIQSLKRSGLSASKLVERYDKPLNAILLSYMTQVEQTGTGYYKRCKFVQDELKRYNAKYLGGGVFLIPPARVPRQIQKRDDLQSWFEGVILKGRYCKLKFLILFDLGKKAFWNSYLPYKQKTPFHFTLGEILEIEDLFTEEQINRIALSDVIRDGDIAWLASRSLSANELEVIHKNQTLIENKLGNPSLRELANDSITNKLSTALNYYGVKNPEEVSKIIIDEAKFWNSRLQ